MTLYRLLVGFIAFPIAAAVSTTETKAQQATAQVSRDALVSRVKTLFPDYVRVCDIREFTADPNASKVIVASLDGSGRFCNEIVLVTSSGTPRIIQEINAWQAINLADVVRDLDGNGTQELVVPRAFSTYEGADCIAVTPIVYECLENGCRQATGGAFASFYSSELGKAQDAVSAALGAPPRESGLACLIMNKDKLLRLIGMSNAGFSQAEEWSKSNDPSLRRKAARIFADIDDAPSRQRLAALAADADPTVASTAALPK